jgi:hypothetical protein
MANHVETNVWLVQANKSATKIFEEAFQSVKDLKEEGLEFSSVLPDWDDEWCSREWMEKNVGPKWAYIQDSEDTWAWIQSAWVPPAVFLEKLANKMAEVDADIKMSAKYIDEFYNFLGVWTFSDGESDYEEESGDWFMRKRAEDIGTPFDSYEVWEDDGWDEWLDETLESWSQDMISEDEDET